MLMAPGFAAVQVRDWFTLCVRRTDFERTIYAALYGTAGAWLAAQLVPGFRRLLGSSLMSLSPSGPGTSGQGTVEGLLSPVLLPYFALVLAICVLLGLSHAGAWYRLHGRLGGLLPRTPYTRAWDEFWYGLLAARRGPTWVDVLTKSGMQVRARVAKVADHPGERDLLLTQVHLWRESCDGKRTLVPAASPAYWLSAESIEWIGHCPSDSATSGMRSPAPARPGWLWWSSVATVTIAALLVTGVALRLAGI